MPNLHNLKSEAKNHILNSREIKLSVDILEVAKSIRGIDRGPAIIIHATLPRSGSTFTSELLRLHTNITAYPNKLWEVPFLECTGDILEFQKNFFRGYNQNINKIGENDFLPLFGSAFIAYLHSFVPKTQRILIKRPIVDFLNYFPSVFPYENLLLLIRDGRDVVSSTIKTWSDLKFSEVCERWEKSTKQSLAFHEQNSNNVCGYMMIKYEHIISDPLKFVKTACECFGLDQRKYPFEKINDILVYGSSSHKREGKVSWEPIAKPNNFKTIGHWQEWSEDKKQTFKEIAGKTLMAAGYCKNLDW